jgi:hypothetical protein
VCYVSPLRSDQLGYLVAFLPLPSRCLPALTSALVWCGPRCSALYWIFTWRNMLETAKLQCSALLHDRPRLNDSPAAFRSCRQTRQCKPHHQRQASVAARRNHGLQVVAASSSSSVDAQSAEAAVLDALQGVKGRGSGGLPPDQQAAFDDAVKMLEADGGVKARKRMPNTQLVHAVTQSSCRD